MQVWSASHPLLPLSKPWQFSEWLAKQKNSYTFELKQQILFILLTYVLCTWIAAVKFLEITIICKIGCDIAIELTTLKTANALVIAIASTFPLPTWFFCSAARIQVVIVWSVAYCSSTYILSSDFVIIPNVVAVV